MARILITGGAGYVGSHCAKALAAAGHEGVVFDNLSFGHRELVRWGRVAYAKKGDNVPLKIGTPTPHSGIADFLPNIETNRDCTICAGMVLI